MLNIFTLNLRHERVDDGENNWTHRKDAVLRLLNEQSPDVFGSQETELQMATWLDQELPEYVRVGAAREGRGMGEHCALYLRAASFQLLDSGDFWLSDTPHIPGSRSFGNEIPRMLTWARVRTKGSNTEWLLCNTHLDYRSELSRHRSARLIRQTLKKLSPEGPYVLMGDFNSSPDSLTIKYLTGKEAIDSDSGDMKDSFDVALEVENIGLGTTHRFGGRSQAISRVDHILVSQNVHVERARVIDQCPNGRLVSDHFPVQAFVGMEM